MIKIPTKVKCGFVWTCFWNPNQDVISISEASGEDCRIKTSGSFGVKVSGFRVMENFLDRA